ncbi:E1 ubiquitin-activating protein uba2 [Coemansia sp. RSA 485]|nr:E1 ubiquitin-activating protein uba2 [Coemansia sp. RSA 485]
MRQTTHISRLFGAETADKLATARVLVVGAGGIGCELLKDLSMSGYRHIHAIDLDTIDLSNLNRQFLFQRKHIKKPKASVAVSAITAFNPQLSAEATQANIKDPQFDGDWFASFDIVFNALDNLDARRHVNAMCLAARVPLIESGTAGYLGQVTVICGGKTECFDCHPKQAEKKSYPVCTIRSTPSAPIHCVVWAKNYLFAQLFGQGDAGEIRDEPEDGDNAEELRILNQEAHALMKLTEAMGTDDFARVVFEKVFSTDIGRLLSMKDMWAQRTPPKALDYALLEQKSSDPAQFDPSALPEHDSLTIEQAFSLFRYACHALAARRASESLEFDKDDPEALWFVAATASLRSFAFGIDQKSIFAAKAMAGNIIPAIATTNAMVAGMMVLQSILVLSNRIQECRTAYLTYNVKRPRSIIKESLKRPNPLCPVCRRRYLTMRVADFAATTLGDVIDAVQALEGPQNLNLGEDISVVEGSRILYDPDYEDNLMRTLESLGLTSGRMLTMASEDDGAAIPVIFSLSGLMKEPPERIVIEGFEHIPEFAPLPEKAKPDNRVNDDQDAVVVVAVDEEPSIDLTHEGQDKRKPESQDIDPNAADSRKRCAVDHCSDEDVTILE